MCSFFFHSSCINTQPSLATWQVSFWSHFFSSSEGFLVVLWEPNALATWAAQLLFPKYFALFFKVTTLSKTQRWHSASIFCSFRISRPWRHSPAIAAAAFSSPSFFLSLLPYFDLHLLFDLLFHLLFHLLPLPLSFLLLLLWYLQFFLLLFPLFLFQELVPIMNIEQKTRLYL